MNAATTRSRVCRSPFRMPESIAALASGAGASDAAVPATSAMNMSTRALGRARAGPRARAACARDRACRAGAGAGRRGGWRRARPRRPTSQPRDLAVGRVAVEEDLVGQALLDDLAIKLGLVEQRLVVAGGRSRAVLEHDDRVGQ